MLNRATWQTCGGDTHQKLGLWPKIKRLDAVSRRRSWPLATPLARGDAAGARRGDRTIVSPCAIWLILSLGGTAHAIEFAFPIDCEVGRSCVIQYYVDHDSSKGARDYQCGTLSYDSHNGTDFRLPTMAI